MNVRDVVRQVVAQLEAASADYLLVGAVAYFVYGLPRATRDADFVIAVEPAALDRILAALPASFEVDPQSRMELFTATMRWVVVIRGSALKVEFFLLGSDAHHQEEFRRRKRLRLPAIEIDAWVATAEDLIIQKLRWARSKDLDDVRNILSVQGAALDFPYIESWCAQHGTLERLEEVRRSIPPGL